MADFYPLMDKSLRYVLLALVAITTATALTTVLNSHGATTCDLLLKLLNHTGKDMIADCQ